MNQIAVNNAVLPIINGCNSCVAAEPFIHADRTLPFHVMLYVLEGTIYVTEEGEDYAIGAGELFFLKKGLHHFGKREIPKGTRWYFVHFYWEEQEQEKLPDFLPEENIIKQGEVLQAKALLPKKLTHLEGSIIEKMFADFIAYFQSEDIYKKWYLNGRLAELLGRIAFYQNGKIKQILLSDKIAGFLNTHKTEAFSASKLEQQFFLSYKHMAAVFKKEKGTTMQQYHTMQRMKEACRLLQSTLIPIGEISGQLGYTDMLYFSRCFHQFSGMSPSDYRRQAPNGYQIQPPSIVMTCPVK